MFTKGLEKSGWVDAQTYQRIAEEAASGAAGTAAVESAKCAVVDVSGAVNLAQESAQTTPPLVYSPVFWFIIGVIFAVVLYYLIEYIKHKNKKKGELR